MKKFLIASAATAALAFAAPAFAQIVGGANETVQGTVTGEVETQTDVVTETPQQEVREATDEAAAAAQAETGVTGETGPATVSVESTTGAGVATADEDSATATASASASTQMAANTDLPSQVQAAVSDGRYTTDDLNRAQLEALLGG